jgi:hypothetical protein
MSNPPDSFFTAQERQLSLFVDRYLLEFVDLLEESRKDLELLISGPESFAQSQALELLPQVDRIASTLKQDIISKQSLLDNITVLSTEHNNNILSTVTGQSFNISFTRLNEQVLARFARNELEKVTGLVDSELRTIKSVLMTKVGVQGENPRQIAKVIAGKQSQFAGRFNHIQTILRTESSTIYNAQGLDSIRQANAVLPESGQLKKRIIENLDVNRNHPVSRVLKNQIQPVDKPFTAKVSDIIAASKVTVHKYRPKSMFWPLKGGIYSGMNLPAHYNDRGIVVASE